MGFIAFEDYFHKEISILWLIVFFALITAFSTIYQKWNINNLLLNLGVLIFMFLILKAIMVFRRRKSQKLINQEIGLGDIIILLVFSLVFSPLNFIVFLDVTLIIGLIYYLIKRKETKKIPLAGIFALAYNTLIIVSIFKENYSIVFQDDLLNII